MKLATLARWAEEGTARVFHDLDVVLSVARRLREKALDLLALFPATARQLIIPLGGIFRRGSRRDICNLVLPICMKGRCLRTCRG